MSLPWIHRWWKRMTAPSRVVLRRREHFRPRLELLEDRTVPSALLSGFNSTLLPPNDDGSSSAIAIDTLGPINFYGTTYHSVYVNNNGNLTFNGPQSTFTPSNLTDATGIPIIAPFFADVYTFGNSGPTGYGTGVVDNHAAFGATWSHVDYYNDTSGSKQNTFQVVLINRSDTGPGNFDIEFNYDQIQWETGNASGGSNGLGGTSARIGYSNGSGTPGTFSEMSGSGVNGYFLDSNLTKGLIHNSIGSSVLGRYIFSVRSGTVINPRPLPPTATPQPTAWPRGRDRQHPGGHHGVVDRFQRPPRQLQHHVRQFRRRLQDRQQHRRGQRRRRQQDRLRVGL